MKTIDKRKYLDPLIVAKLDNMALRARLVVEGYLIGQHKSPYHGFSVEFVWKSVTYDRMQEGEEELKC